MKRLLLTLLTVFAFSGFVFSQEAHWPELNEGPFEGSSSVIAFIQIEGEFITAEDSYDQVEVAAFVNGEYRGHIFMEDYSLEFGDPYPIAELMVFYYENESQPVTFMMYDHSTGIEYNTYLVNQDVVTAVDNDQIWMGDYDNALIINFMPALTKDIVGYGASTDGGYYLIASPLHDVIAPSEDNGFITESFDLYSFDQNEADEWRNYKASEFSLENGMGYLYASQQDTQLTFAGRLYDGDGEVELTYNTSAGLVGWNLIGNPFYEEAYVDHDYYVLNQEGSEVLTESVGSGTAIEPMTGIFVLAEGASETANFTTGGRGAKGSEIALNLSNGRGVIDRAIVRFGEGRQLPKFQLNPSHTKVYIPQDGKDYAIASAGEMGEMPVSFKAESNGNYTMSFTSQEVSFAYLHLVDNMTGTDVDLLATPSYSFEARTTDYASRFKLVFATGNNTEDSFAFFNNGNWIISNEGEATLQVIDVMGRILSSETISGSCSKAVNAASGVYMLRLINGNDVKVQKVVVR